MSIQQLQPGDPIPGGVPRRFKNAAGYVRLRWRVARNECVEGYEHRIIVGNPAGCHVHHKNGIKDDNRPENLEIVTDSEHARLHHPMTWDIGEAARLYQSGWSLPRLSAKYGLNTGNIHRALKSRGISMRGLGELLRSRTDEAEVRRLHLSGSRAPHIAERMGVPIGAVRRVIKELGLPGHPSGNPGHRAAHASGRRG